MNGNANRSPDGSACPATPTSCSTSGSTSQANCPEDWIFQVDSLEFGYHRNTKFRLTEVSLQIPRGQAIGIVGASGSGKSTLLGVLGLLLRPRRSQFESLVLHSDREGLIEYRQISRRRQVDVRRRLFGFALQSAFLQRNLSSEHNVLLPLLANGSCYDQARARLNEVLDRFPELDRRVRGVLPKSPNSLSGGEQRSVAVLRAVVHDPEVVFADEPFANLDRRKRGLIAKLLESWQRSQTTEIDAPHPPKTLLLVTHELDLALKTCDGVYAVVDGKVKGDPSPKGHLPMRCDQLTLEQLEAIVYSDTPADAQT